MGSDGSPITAVSLNFHGSATAISFVQKKKRVMIQQNTHLAQVSL